MLFRHQLVTALIAAAGCVVPMLLPAQQMPGMAGSAQATSKPPQVTYHQGQLKVSAHNSTLREVLQAIRAQTGTLIEGPTGQANERVVVELGPAPVSEVLRDLLQGSRFDYVILGAADKPGVEKIILSPRGAAPPRPVAQAAPPPEPEEPEPMIEEPVVAAPEGQTMPGQQPMPGQQMPGMQPNGFPGAAISPNGVDSMGQPIQQQPGTPPDALMQNPNQQQGDPNQPKSPEQLLRELQMMQQREQQNQNQ
ncbi:MAG: hypothetical protein AB7O65_00330 [Candidatus Korobacteraceae bacterium]